MPAKTAKRPKRKAASALNAISSSELIDRLAEAARIGALFIEGEDCQRMLVPEAREWTDPDDINFDASVAVPIKKTLLRIEKIERFPYHAILWSRRSDDPGMVEVMIAGSMNSSYSRGKRENVPIFPEIRKVFDTGKPAARRGSNAGWEQTAKFRFGHVWLMAHDSLLRAGKRIVSHFQPIRDSRETVVAALELTCVGSDG